MDRRTFVSTAAGALLVKALPANAQPPKKVPRIGVLVPGAPATASHLTAAFTQGLREHGYVDGQNVVVERRFADNRAERMSEIAAELVRLKVDVIVVGTDLAIAAAKRQTRSIPIMRQRQDFCHRISNSGHWSASPSKLRPGCERR